MGIVARVFKEGEEDQTTDYRLHLELMNSGRRRGSDLRLQTTDIRLHLELMNSGRKRGFTTDPGKSR